MELVEKLGRTPRSLIVDGRVVMRSHYRLLASNPKGHDTVFSINMNSDTRVCAEGRELFEHTVKETPYKSFMPSGSGDGCISAEREYDIDPFTNAVCTTTKGYRIFLDKRMHATDTQMSVEEKSLLNNAFAQFIVNYCDVFCQLISRRLSFSSMPYKVKGHFVQGLFQPIRVSSPCIPSPFDYPELDWFISALGDNTEKLMDSMDSGKVTIEAISSYDFAQLIHAPLQVGMNRFLFVLCNFYCILETEGRKAETDWLIRKYGKYLLDFLDGRGKYHEYYSAVKDFCLKAKAGYTGRK